MGKMSKERAKILLVFPSNADITKICINNKN